MAHHFWSYYRTLERRGLQAGAAVVVGIPCGANTRFSYGFANYGLTAHDLIMALTFIDLPPHSSALHRLYGCVCGRAFAVLLTPKIENLMSSLHSAPCCSLISDRTLKHRILAPVCATPEY
jgi:hypothetical protein